MHYSEYENITGRAEYDVRAAADRASTITILLDKLDDVLYNPNSSTSDHYEVSCDDAGMHARRTLSYWKGNVSGSVWSLDETQLTICHDYDRRSGSERYNIMAGWMVHQSCGSGQGLVTAYQIDSRAAQPVGGWIEEPDLTNHDRTIGRSLTPYDIDGLCTLLDSALIMMNAGLADSLREAI